MSKLAPLLGMGKGAETAATVIVTLLISYITLVLGELYPKQVALQVPEQYARGVSGFISVLKAAFRPFIWFLNASTGLLKRLTPIDSPRRKKSLPAMKSRRCSTPATMTAPSTWRSST